MFWTNIILFIIFSLVALTFGLQNPEIVPINLFGKMFETTIGLVIILAFMIGAILVFLLTMIQSFSKTYQIKKLQDKITEIEKRTKDNSITYESGGLGEEGEFLIDSKN